MFDILSQITKIMDTVEDLADMASQIGDLLKNFDMAALGDLLGDLSGIISLIPGAQPVGAAFAAADMLTDVASSIDLE